jgi:outer membrane protein OmpA-like peptidoglycan-associated protein
MADKYFCNFSLFQSMPDSWGIDQLFPIMPIARLNEHPTRSATLQDITCDSDGKITAYVNGGQQTNYIPLHPVSQGEHYYIGVFLVGAYQEILGNMHNLFGDTNAVHISVNKDDYTIEQVIDGETVADVLEYVQYDPKKLVRRLEIWVSKAIKDGKITLRTDKGDVDASDVSLIGRMNLMNLFAGYEGMPRPFEIETVTGLGWLHHYMNGVGDTDDLSARVGLNFNFNLGEDAAWTIGLKPAVVFNLTGDYPSKKMALNRKHANMEILLGLTYHFADGDGNRHFAMVNTVDPMEVAAMNVEINDLREVLAAKDIELVGLADELLVVQNQLNEARNKQVEASGKTIHILESVVAFPFNQSDVQSSQMSSLEHVANYLKKNPDANITVNGYASPEGTEEYNLQLSQRRADAVKNLLVSKYGIEADRINAIGHGVGDIFSEPAWNRVGICTIDETN